MAGSGARLVTLSTDLGPVYSAQMKGVLMRWVPAASVVELTHELPAHGIRESAFLLRQMTGTFPAGTVHVAIVDPGVGGTRAAIAIRCTDGSVLVGPDNGLMIPARERFGGGRAFRLDPQRVVPGETLSATFHGRDLFAPAAGRIASGTAPADLGSPFRARYLELAGAKRHGPEVDGEVLHVDRFGNLVTNVPTDWIDPVPQQLGARVGRAPSRELNCVRTYSELRPGELGLVGSSFGTFELAVREGRASDRLAAGVGTPIRLSPVVRTRVRVKRA
jgi:S-adenosylmethionine hydrolase